MSAGQLVRGPDGTDVELVDIGQRVLLEAPGVRVWSVDLGPGETQPWHLHYNPYLVLCLAASPGRMDWLDGSPPRFLDEYVGGAVYRPISPVHRLTNIGSGRYVNRLIEFCSLGEDAADPPDIGSGARSVHGKHPPGREPDGRSPVLVHPHTRIWVVSVTAGKQMRLDLGGLPHVTVESDPDVSADGVLWHPVGGPVELANPGTEDRHFYVVELSHVRSGRHHHQEEA